MQRIVKPAYHLPYETVGTPEYTEGFTDWPLNEEFTDMADIYYKYYHCDGDKIVREINYKASREMSEQELIDAVTDSDTSLSFDIESINRTNHK